MSNDNPFSELPSITLLLERLQSSGMMLANTVATVMFDRVLGEVRAEIAGGARFTREEIVKRAIGEVRGVLRPRLTPVINATGVVLHTNLGRAPVSEATAEAMREVAGGYVSLEIEPESGLRGGRMSEVSRLMGLLTGAEATLVVNNNAAAVLLTLSALASGKSVIVSRGEAIEIGGGFRIPDVLRQSGAQLVEVGTTNRTYARDYLDAIDEVTAVLLKVHPSNFSIEGFTATTSIEELAEIGRERGVAVVEDLGSGALLDTRQFGLRAEPTIGGSLAAGATLVTASGDKLLGGPQAGIIAGSAEWVRKVERHPLARAVRADKTCLAGVAATLRHYVAGDVTETIPVWRMVSATMESLWARGEAIAAGLSDGFGPPDPPILGGERRRSSSLQVEVVRSEATIGGGSLPGQTLASVGVSVSGGGIDLDGLAGRLRVGKPGVFGRIVDGRLILNLRTVLAEDDGALVGAVREGLAG